MNVGFIGLGHMGVPMSGRILAAGHDLIVHDLRREAAAGLLAPGAVWIDMSTSVPAVADRIRAVAEAREIAVLDAPVSGMAAGARAGPLPGLGRPGV